MKQSVNLMSNGSYFDYEKDLSQKWSSKLTSFIMDFAITADSKLLETMSDIKDIANDIT